MEDTHLRSTEKKLQQQEIKQLLGKEATRFVKNGMLLGLGTGSTAAYFIESLGVLCRNGLKITTVSSSVHSLELAKRYEIPTIDMEGVIEIDLTIDGADEVDSQNRMIKGGGGAHVREKIIASSSKQFIVIVDEGKLVNTLGKCGVPVEIVPFGYHSTIVKLQKLGYDGNLRILRNAPHITDNGNFIFDIHEPKEFPHPEEDHIRIISIPGVVDSGFFLNLPAQILVGYADGRVAFRN